jgi:hypothetical protein
MKLAIAWVLFGIPLGAAIFAGVGLWKNWNTEHRHVSKVSAVLFPMAATLLACGATAYVQFVRPLLAFDYRVESLGLLLSFAGTISGLVTLRFPRWFSTLALSVSAWMLVWFFLLGSTY